MLKDNYIHRNLTHRQRMELCAKRVRGNNQTSDAKAIPLNKQLIIRPKTVMRQNFLIATEMS